VSQLHHRKTVEDRETGVLTLATGVSSGSVTFAETWLDAPERTRISVSSPEGGDILFANVVDGTATSTGFDFQLSAETPAAGYKLHFVCKF
jgi:hypothetical protein